MDAIEFLKENDRMCKTFDSCSGKDGGEMCELYVKSNEKGLGCADYATTYPEEAVKIIEKWAKEHPKKTRQSEFLKMFPEAPIFDGVLEIEPCKLVGSKLNTEVCHSYDEFGLSGCYECRKKYWLEETENEKEHN